MERKIPYKISHRNVKYPRLEFKTGELVCVLPFDETPDLLIEKHEGWILKKSQFIEECLKASADKELVFRGDEEFKDRVHSCVDKASIELGTKLNNIYFRKMRTKWASLSPKKNLIVNMLMKYLPGYLIEYIIFHEMIHTVEKRHNEKFWKIVSSKFQDYGDMEKDLFIYWFLAAKKLSKLNYSPRGHKVTKNI